MIKDELLHQYSPKKAFSTKKEGNLEFVEGEISSQERKIENIRHRMESLKKDLIDAGGSQKRNLKSVTSKCPIKSPNLLGSLFVNEVGVILNNKYTMSYIGSLSLTSNDKFLLNSGKQ